MYWLKLDILEFSKRFKFEKKLFLLDGHTINLLINMEYYLKMLKVILIKQKLKT